MRFQDVDDTSASRAVQSPPFFTIPKLAKRLGITPASIRLWVQLGLVEAPPELPVTGERAYPAEMVARIERWYMGRLAAGQTRGPGARKRRERGRQWVTANTEGNCQ